MLTPQSQLLGQYYQEEPGHNVLNTGHKIHSSPVDVSKTGILMFLCACSLSIRDRNSIGIKNELPTHWHPCYWSGPQKKDWGLCTGGTGGHYPPFGTFEALSFLNNPIKNLKKSLRTEYSAQIKKLSDDLNMRNKVWHSCIYSQEIRTAEISLVLKLLHFVNEALLFLTFSQLGISFALLEHTKVLNLQARVFYHCSRISQGWTTISMSCQNILPLSHNIYSFGKHIPKKCLHMPSFSFCEKWGTVCPLLYLFP